MQPVLKIHSSRNAPDRANVAVQHRGWLLCVDDTDLTSKRIFQRIQMLFLTPALRRLPSIIISCRESGVGFIVAGTAEDMFNGDEPMKVFITTH